jgi:secreted trypsin-like serine protease
MHVAVAGAGARRLKDSGWGPTVAKGKRGRRLSLLAVAIALVVAALPAAAAAATQAPLIIGGSGAASGWGFMAFVQNNEHDFLCSGTVVAPELVLTAGHCAADEITAAPYAPSGYTVYTGNVEWPLGTQSAVSQVIVYPGFTPVTTGNGSNLVDGDAALLELSTPTAAPPIALASDPTNLSLLDGGTAALIAGWGLTDPYADAGPSDLQYGDTVVQSPTYCAQQASTTGNLFDETDQVCAIDAPSGTEGICNGDSGGPLITAEPGSTTPVEIGLTSYSINSCDTALPQYFTRADAISSWVNQWITALAPPTATTTAATSVSETTAELTGSATTGGATTTVDFQWGTTIAYGNTTTPNVVSSPSTVNEQTGITGLSPSTAYHFRLVASSANGTVYGADESFTTAVAPAPPPTPPAPTVEGLSAAVGKSDARDTLKGVFHHDWTPRNLESLKCSRISGVKLECFVQWWSGPNDYYGDVYVWNELVSGKTEWTDHYTIRWVNDHCYFHTKHPKTCRVSKRSGTY